jgi:hypothetical protein
MKQLHFPFRLLPALFLFSFILVSCVDHRYDLTDENLDKDVVFSPDGFNIPVGSIDTIFIGNELRKLIGDNEADLLADPATGMFYIEYSGDFPVEFPEYTIPTFTGVETEIVDVEDLLEFENPIQYPYLLSLEASDQPRRIVTDKHATYNLEQPYFRTPTEGLEVLVEEAYFTRYELNITIYLYNLDFLNNSQAKLLLSMDFPANFTFQEYAKDPITGKTHIERTINVSEFQGDHQHTVTEVARLFSYQYEQENVALDYNVDLLHEEATQIAFTAFPQFNMHFNINNDHVVLDYITGSARGVESISGAIETGDFTSSFKGNTLGFSNPSLLLNLQSNLQANFYMGMNLAAKADDGSVIGSAAADQLAFEKGAGELIEKQFLLSPSQPAGIDYWTPFSMNNLFLEIPKTVDYELKAHFDDNNVKLYPEGLIFSTRYTLKLPFEFDAINLEIADTIPNLFSEDLYDKLFKHADGNLQIRAENVDLSLGNNMRMEVTTKIVDQNYRNIGIEDQTFTLQSGPDNRTFSVEIKQADMEKMKNARHLEFIFKLAGSGAIFDANHPSASYIHIRNLRIVSSSGLHFEL